LDLLSDIKEFIEEIAKRKTEIYNEASVQYELAIFFRNKFQDYYKIQLERNIDYFGINKRDFIKKEMDLVVFTPDKKKKYCIEIKFPTQGQHPEQMFKSCKDIAFLEQLKDTGFTKLYFLMFTDDELFYEQRENDYGIYLFFRRGKELTGEIIKPTGKKDEKIQIKGKYYIKWIGVFNKFKYFIIEV